MKETVVLTSSVKKKVPYDFNNKLALFSKLKLKLFSNSDQKKVMLCNFEC